MKHRWSLKGQNKGASLLAVLVALIFVGILGVIITNITITNIRMREIEQSSKKNFYSAEEVLDDLKVGLNEAAAKSMQKAYADIMANYHGSMTGGADIQKDFTKLYIENLKDIFYDSTVAPQESFDFSDPMNPVTIYQEGSYLTDEVKDCFSTAAAKNCFATDAADAIYDADYEKGIFILRNICISYTDSLDYTTTLSTDIVFHTPALNSAKSNVVQEFMRYALIADVQIEVGSPNVTVDGSVYAGRDGIVSKGSGNYGVFTGKTIVTRGDITTESGTRLEIGTDLSRIWAENITTEGNGPSDLTLRGSCYIADDLNMGGVGSKVTLDGRYYGYNFQKQYDTLQKETDSAFSSAMMINAKDSHLNLEQIDYLLLAGRTFISRGSAGNTQNNDIMTGESLSVRTNQLAYNVPLQYLNVSAGAVGTVNFTPEGRTAYETYIGVPDIGSYLNAAAPVTAYHYKDNNVPSVRYYLNFASGQRANDFFAAYYAANSQNVNAKAAGYAADDALVVDAGTLLTLKGDILYRDAANAELEGAYVTLSNADWEPGTGGAADGSYWTLAAEYAATYKALQKSLKEEHGGIALSDIRFVNAAGQIDKSVEPLFETFIDKPAFQAAVGASETVLFEEPASGGVGKRVAVVIDNNYQIPPEYREGIVIATGDVKVMGEFTGMIISGGTISFATNATVHAADGIVSQLFSVIPEFGDYFRDYDTFSESMLGMIQIDDYLTYDNWKKNED